MRELSPKAVEERLRDGSVLLIDVREPHEFAEARIDGALNFPLSTFNPAALPRGLCDSIILHCGAGKRSAKALEKCFEAGVPIDVHMAGGLGAWRADGLPVVEVDPATGQLKKS